MVCILFTQKIKMKNKNKKIYFFFEKYILKIKCFYRKPYISNSACDRDFYFAFLALL